MLKQLILEKERNLFVKWLKSLRFNFFLDSSMPIYIFAQTFSMRTFKAKYFYSHVLFFSRCNLNFISNSQRLSLEKNFKRTISKKIPLNFLIPVSFNFFKKPAQVRMGNGRGQKFNKQIYKFTYGFPFFQSKYIRSKFLKKINNKISKKTGISTRVLNLRKFFFSS